MENLSINWEKGSGSHPRTKYLFINFVFSVKQSQKVKNSLCNVGDGTFRAILPDLFVKYGKCIY